MTETAREQLLGYLLGALEENEQADIEKLLDEDAQLRHDLAVLNRALSPLDACRREFSPPPALASRTCAFVEENASAGVDALAADTQHSETSGNWKTPAPSTSVAKSASRPSRQAAMRPVDAAPCRPSRARWQDSIMAVGIMLVASGLLFPAIMDSRERARLMSCQNNLRQLGAALSGYSENNNGYFPKVPAQGNLAAAGIYAPRLAAAGYLDDAHQVICPGSPLADEPDFSVATIDQLRSACDPEELASLQDRMGGSYGYLLGHMENGDYRHTKNRHREHFAILADAPSHLLPSHQSQNHGGRGQNVLFEDGHVKFLPTPRPQGLSDDVFTNDKGQVAAGVHADDSVLGSSRTAPFAPAGLR